MIRIDSYCRLPLLAGIMVLFLCSCKKDKTDTTTISFTNLPAQDIETALQGNWHLISWCGGLSGGCAQFDNHAWGAKLRFTGNTAIFSNLDGENLRGTMSWSSSGWGDSLRVLYVDSVDVGIPTGIENGALTLMSESIDGYGRSYQRD